MAFVYLLNDSESYKVGVTKNINRRIKTLQTGNKNKINLIYKFETNTPYKLEKILHKHYFSYKAERLGEWFDLPDNEVFNFLTKCGAIQKMIDFMSKNNFFYK